MNTPQLTGKVALITGAARGIGKAVALLFAREGCQLALVMRKMNDNALQTVQEIEQTGAKCKAYSCDAADFEQVQSLVKQVEADFGRIDILVNNAGITQDTLLLRMSETQWDTVIQVNLKSVFNFIHAISPVMLHQRSGSIISMSSVVGIYGNAGQANYAASKAGIIALTQTTAKELGSRGIRANAIAPGFIQTDMTASLSKDITDETCRFARGGGTSGTFPCLGYVLVCKRTSDSSQLGHVSPIDFFLLLIGIAGEVNTEFAEYLAIHFTHHHRAMCFAAVQLGQAAESTAAVVVVHRQHGQRNEYLVGMQTGVVAAQIGQFGVLYGGNELLSNEFDRVVHTCQVFDGIKQKSRHRT